MTRTWALLLALAAASTLVGAAPPGALRSWTLLALAGAKARLILRHWLRLDEAPDWARGFDLGLFGLLVAMGLLA